MKAGEQGRGGWAREGFRGGLNGFGEVRGEGGLKMTENRFLAWAAVKWGR